ncbi:peptidase C60 [Wenjunlia vitaminophila]|uniref:Peptidase C60 n=1 Tax=Wenjunlia vitaminophila TaxID=76728 RepID=A0A0T6LWB4_WENVI|nr:class F sortase [Wenjunlia vitaminophila]KRV50015.1 peptidase C60 [Wenjunlia vitaminophila]
MTAPRGSAGGARRRPERGNLFALGVAAFAAAIGVCMLCDGMAARTGPPQPPASAAVSGVGHPWVRAHRTGTPVRALPASPPVAISIPAIRVEAPVAGVGSDEDGGIAPPPPTRTNLAGWFRGSPAPGADGTSVVVGHVDNEAGPVVFYGLGALEKGNTIQITRRDGSVAEFVVYGVEVFDKKDFPGERVYGRTGQPELRLITCGGGYSKQLGYLGNVVVFARMVGPG